MRMERESPGGTRPGGGHGAAGSPATISEGEGRLVSAASQKPSETRARARRSNVGNKGTGGCSMSGAALGGGGGSTAFAT